MIRRPRVPDSTKTFRSRNRRMPRTPSLAVDGVVVRGGQVLLVERANLPFRGSWALPGGFVEVGETTEAAVVREVREETGLRTQVLGILGVYSDPGRDGRGHVVSVVYRLSPKGGRVNGGSDARQAAWWPLRDLPPLAFDHARIVDDAQKRRS